MTQELTTRNREVDIRTFREIDRVILEVVEWGKDLTIKQMNLKDQTRRISQP